MLQTAMATAVLIVVLMPTTPSSAMEWLSASELEQSCDTFLADSVKTDGALCLAYIQGFLAGTYSVGVADADSRKNDSSSESETFSERAARTRLGTLRLQEIRAARKSDYCIGDDVTAVIIVEKIVGYLKEHPETLQLTNSEAVREALINNFRCAK